MALCFPFGEGPFGAGAFGGCDDAVIHPDCGFGLGPFGLGPFGLSCTPRYVVRGLKVVAAYDGPQMVLSWIAPIEPGKVDRLRILRRTMEFPRVVNDPRAVVVLDTPNATITKFADTVRNPAKLGSDPVAGVVHYYKVFTDVDFAVGLSDSLGGSEGYDLCYSAGPHDLTFDFPRIDEMVWDHLIPDSWGATDALSSQRTLAALTDPATAEIAPLADSKESEGFAERFVRIWILLAWRAYAHARTVRDIWDVWAVRADALRHLAMVLGTDVDDRGTIGTLRRDVLDAVHRHRRKGSKVLIEIMARQITGQTAAILVEMTPRIHSAWNPQSPDAELSPGLIIGRADDVDAVGDPNTYCWNPTMDTTYNERGWRLHFDVPLDADDRSFLLAVLRSGKPVVSTVGVWEVGTNTILET